ncbi:LytR C-terminal domain-containing protein [Streptomyces sp. C11-1]|uniref:LytR C-terminal domain-containing protein n=1 Tax=Streptomyces durocortorensis TaxID=2811104 RepID=A0ABY9W5K3_9ACTN|nr:LytR C-terminal domain-containing protein [Streptomyces durocortorensis]WNF31293.1 LytR C-terminal domain-containing protein [Streptomyces durocortorensis]
MGGKYRITGDTYPRMRRPRRRGRLVLAGVCAVVALGLAGWGTLQLIDVFTGGDKSANAVGHQRDCPTPKPSAPARALPKPAAIKVNVYNATTRSGLAKSAAEELKKRGFAVGEVGNASKEYDKKVPGTAVLLGAPTATNGSFTVLGTQLVGTVQKTDTRKTAEVDLILGAKFKAFNTPQEATAAMAALTAKPSPAPSSC